ncbi:MAG: glucose 1-dehydrogenase [Alphaproteobacteria bacterium]|nr:glucose 1-dehydrogenase [Alphaproteobacteria bacterium]
MAFDPNTMLRLDGEVALVTGAARGIGAASAALLAAAGAEVLVADLDGAAAEAGAAAIRARGHRAHGLVLDVADDAGVAAAFEAVRERHGRLDVLVNNAGIALRKPTTELPRADWDKVVAVNLTGVFLCAQAAASIMLAGGGGRIVNLASIMGLSGGGLYPNISYQSTKGAVVNMTRALAVEWSKQNIRVNAVAPTWVKTELTRPLFENPELHARLKAVTPMERFPAPDDIAAAVLFLASRASAFVTGHTLAVDSGFLAQ